MKKFCQYCKDETEMVFLREETYYSGVNEVYECLICHNEVDVNLGKESLK